MRRYPKGLLLGKKKNDEIARKSFSAIRITLGGTHLHNAVVSRGKKYDVLLYVENTAAHTRDRKLSATFNGLLFYLYATSLFQGLRSMHRTACKRHPLSFENFPCLDTLQTMTFSLP